MPVKVPVSNELIEAIGRSELERQLSVAGEIVGSAPADGVDAHFRTVYCLDIPGLPPETERAVPVFQGYQGGVKWKTRVLRIDCWDASGHSIGTVEA